ncbi:transposase [Nonomuraea indica]|uniref:Transposase n=1 Tax=Nonomuraea indica TaxID=1581193 RepID=A0ABW7ZUW2_9ACTN
MSRNLTRRPSTGRPLGGCRRIPGQRQSRFIAPALFIDQRPAVVEFHHGVGDWRGLIIGWLNRSAIVILVKHSSCYLRLALAATRHDAQAVRDGLIAVLDSLPPAVRLTLTWDQGAEMAYHDQLAAYLSKGVYFAHRLVAVLGSLTSFHPRATS